VIGRREREEHELHTSYPQLNGTLSSFSLYQRRTPCHISHTDIMASEKAKAGPTDEELLAQLEALGDEDAATRPATKPSGTKASRTPATAQQQSEADLLAELGNLAQERPKSRPHTPRISGTAASQGSPRKGGTATPPPATSTRSSEEKGPTQTRRSGDSTRSFHQSFTPGTEAESPDAEPERKAAAVPESKPQSSGSWWGGLVATASAAVKQAESLAKEIQKNEEAQRWAEQVKGNVGALRGLGMAYIILLMALY